ncbi:unnamed protein product [Triticum aestivum]|uniref:(bread wheat) hypothetical protein n=1 Tax=Triticum aestivum TaxID=4565 RepID=A0A7G2IGB4_WHEAT|nr:unnamed protein product [Triticum aestivum]
MASDRPRPVLRPTVAIYLRRANARAPRRIRLAPLRQIQGVPRRIRQSTQSPRGTVREQPHLLGRRGKPSFLIQKIPDEGISVLWHEADAPAALLRGALNLHTGTGRGGVELSIGTPYMIMRPDVFREGKNPTATVKWVVPVPKPFELCYKGGFPMLKRTVGHDVRRINLVLGDGATGNWTLFDDSYMVPVDGAMWPGDPADGARRHADGWRAGGGDQREAAGEQPAGVRPGETGARVQHAARLVLVQLHKLQFLRKLKSQLCWWC